MNQEDFIKEMDNLFNILFENSKKFRGQSIQSIQIEPFTHVFRDKEQGIRYVLFFVYPYYRAFCLYQYGNDNISRNAVFSLENVYNLLLIHTPKKIDKFIDRFKLFVINTI